ncbi:hypothetical protein BJ508DRAFT_329942 [Ascobolus immersus RN42]|uniref:Uncharacterized protein n=1 Tax=Ascobolus immersus RN42 TaxID=1160509 RepID=A0A3N4I797_ASCIM|nr:hypothetical protein BJ508DRAFT_329942 [Ascobolus immersus RN42]
MAAPNCTVSQLLAMRDLVGLDFMTSFDNPSISPNFPQEVTSSTASSTMDSLQQYSTHTDDSHEEAGTSSPDLVPESLLPALHAFPPTAYIQMASQRSSHLGHTELEADNELLMSGYEADSEFEPQTHHDFAPIHPPSPVRFINPPQRRRRLKPIRSIAILRGFGFAHEKGNMWLKEAVNGEDELHKAFVAMQLARSEYHAPGDDPWEERPFRFLRRGGYGAEYREKADEALVTTRGMIEALGRSLTVRKVKRTGEWRRGSFQGSRRHATDEDLVTL